MQYSEWGGVGMCDVVGGIQLLPIKKTLTASNVFWMVPNINLFE